MATKPDDSKPISKFTALVKRDSAGKLGLSKALNRAGARAHKTVIESIPRNFKKADYLTLATLPISITTGAVAGALVGAFEGLEEHQQCLTIEANLVRALTGQPEPNEAKKIPYPLNPPKLKM